MPDQTVLEEARQVTDAATNDFIAGTHRALVVRAGAGAGKSGLVVQATCAAAAAGMRVVVAAPTNAQVADLVCRIAPAAKKVQIAYLHKQPGESFQVDPRVTALSNVTATHHPVMTASAPIVISTMDKLAFSAAKMGSFDRMILDEAYQADSTRYMCVAPLAERHLLVGDSGQLDPFSTVDCSRWRGLSEDPLLTAIGVLEKNHRDSTGAHALPLTRRLPASAVPVVQPAFYGRGLPFRAASLPPDREMRLAPSPTKRDRLQRAAHAALDGAAMHGWAHLELADKPVLTADPEAVEIITHLVAGLFARSPKVRCEKTASSKRPWTELGHRQVAVVVSHNDQKDLVRARFEAEGLDDVLVDTANRAQGLEFEVVIAWHPLAGLVDLDEFHLAPGRACVMLTRHRQACIVVGRAGDRDALRYQPPTPPAFLGEDKDPLLDGWEAHRHVFDALTPHVISA